MPPRPSLLRRIDETHVPMLVGRLVIGLLFVSYGLHKVENPIEFLKILKEYHLLPLEPPYFMNLTVVALPWIEILCGVLLILGLWLRGSGLVVLVMMVVFTTAVTIRALGEYHQSGVALCAIEFECGCGPGPIVFCTKFLENTGLTLLALIVTVSRSRHLALDAVWDPRPGP